jgi:hypothetical protein
MKKTNSLLILIIGVLLYSCNSNFDIGGDLVDTQSGIVIVDTFQLRLSTVLLDSVPTSGTTQLLCGKYTTLTTGSTEMIPYFNFDLGDELSSITEDDILDSVTLELGYSHYYMGDTTQLQVFSLYRLTEELDFIDSEITDDYIFNKSSFPHESTPMGTVSFHPYVSDDSLEFRLDETFFRTLISKVIANSSDVDASMFNQYMKGFVLKSAADSKSILGFAGDTSGVKLNIYTHLIGPEVVEKRYTLPLSSKGTHYHQAVSDRTGTPYASLRYQEEEIRATASNDKSFIAGGAGIVSRVEFPSLDDVFLYGDRVMIKAQLVLFPSTENDADLLPQALVFYESDRHNSMGSALVSTSSSQAQSVQATLVPDKLYPENNYYIADITEYLTAQFSGNYYNTQNGLLVTIPYTDLQKTADLLVLNGEGYPKKFRPQLKLYFLKYE